MAGGLARNPERGNAPAAGARAAPVHPAAHQAAGGARTAGEDRADDLLRAGGRAAQAVRRAARALSRDRCCGASRRRASAKSKMHVLEALLRLRQAACHPGLLDAKRVGEPSAKLDVLLDQLDELREEGHKALVFSQFTSLLAIVRARLDEAGVRYEYLDGATRDRAGARRRVPERPATAAVPDQPEGGRTRAEPDRGGVRLPARPLVEPGGGGAGGRPRAPHRPDAPGVRLPPDRARHGRGEGAGTAEERSATWPTPSSARTTV